jgi:hypothetical protein
VHLFEAVVLRCWPEACGVWCCHDGLNSDDRSLFPTSLSPNGIGSDKGSVGSSVVATVSVSVVIGHLVEPVVSKRSARWLGSVVVTTIVTLDVAWLPWLLL